MSALARFVVVPAFVVGVAVVGVGCESCKKGVGVTSAVLDKPPKEEVEKQTKESLRNAASIASELCGFPTDGLSDVEVEVINQLLTTSEVHVSGKPLPFDAGVEDPMFDASTKRRDAGAKGVGAAGAAGAKDAGAAGAKDGGGSIDLPRAAICTGVVTVVMSGDFTPDFQGRTDWKVLSGAAGIQVKGIETPGVKFDEAQHRPASSGHHHHH